VRMTSPKNRYQPFGSGTRVQVPGSKTPPRRDRLSAVRVGLYDRLARAQPLPSRGTRQQHSDRSATQAKSTSSPDYFDDARSRSQSKEPPGNTDPEALAGTAKQTKSAVGGGR
jgi:hypothetical protein